MINFTKNLTKENRKAGEWLLGYYYRDSKLSKAPLYPITNFQGMINFLDKQYPTYIEALGENLASVPSDKMILAMKDAAKRGLTDYPRPAYFDNSIMKFTGVSISSVVSDTVKETASDIVDFTQGAFKGLFIVAGILIVAYGVTIYLNAGGKIPKFKMPKMG